MDPSIFASDPLIGCPFDDSAMNMVETWKGFSVGDTVEFKGLNALGTWVFPRIQGIVVGIGENAKLLDGDPFVAFAIKVGDTVYIKTHRDVNHVI